MKSKTLAERAAWDFVAKEGGVELAVINPTAVLGPVLGPDYSPSIMIVQRMLDGAIPGCPQRWFGIVDVRDLADLHVRAMTNPAARGERFLAAAGDFMSMVDIARVLKARLGAAARESAGAAAAELARAPRSAARPGAEANHCRARPPEERHQRQGAGTAGMEAALTGGRDRRHCRKPDPPRTSQRHHEKSCMNDFFRRYLLPGFVFESAVIAGGYATGRELVEFFLPAGPWGGVLGMIVSMLFWSAVLMVSFELARMAKAYDYRSFFKLLLGRGWFLFEIAYFLLMIIILAVMGAAAGEITHALFGLPKLIGSMSMIAATGLMLFYSNTAIEKFLTYSVGYLYLVYIVFFVWSFVAFGDRIEPRSPLRRSATAGSRQASRMPATTSRPFRQCSSAFAT